MQDQDLLFMRRRRPPLIRARKLSPVEYLDAVLAQAEAQQGRCNAFVTLDAEGARVQARQAEQDVMDGKPARPGAWPARQREGSVRDGRRAHGLWLRNAGRSCAGP